MKNKVLLFLLSLVVAVGTWFYVVNVVSPDSEITIHNVTVDVQGKPNLTERNLMVTSNTDNTKVDIVLTGNRTDLIKLSRSDIIVTADVSKLEYKENRQEIPLDVYVPNTSVAVKSISPGQIYVTVENRVTNREVRLDVNYDKDELPPDYIVKESLKEYPEVITVAGPESLMSQLDHAEINLDLKERQTGFNEEAVAYKLYDKEGRVMEHELLEHSGQVNVTLPILYTKRLPLSLNLKDGGGVTAQQATVKFYIPAAEGSNEEPKDITDIKVSGSKAVLDQVDKLTLKTVDLAEIRIQDQEPITILLDEIPLLNEENINAEDAPTEIYALITFEGIEEQEFKNVIIEQENLPQNMYVPALGYRTIVIRGPADLMKKLSRENVRLVVDLTGAEIGTKEYQLKVVFDSEIFEVLGWMIIDPVQVEVVPLPGVS